MNKKRVITMTIILSVLLILFIPIPTGVSKDGGTRTYTALTYKVVKWNRILVSNSEVNAKIVGKSCVYFRN